MDDLLKKLYFNPITGFAGAHNLFEAAKKVEPSLSYAYVKKWLAQQPTYTLHKYARRNYKRNKTLVSDIDEQWQLDLVDVSSLSKYNGGNKYLLTCIDILSKFAWCEPVKNKTGPTILKAFENILNSNRKPQKIQTDAGNEF